MNKAQAFSKLANVIAISRVEMYKPIQVAEVLHAARSDSSIILDDLETYRIKSKKLRDEVTRTLFGKVSTSSAKYQDDLWADTSVPPEAMKLLGEINFQAGSIEEYIYQSVWVKNRLLIQMRDQLEGISTREDIEKLFSDFDSDGLRTSSDRLFEIFCVAVLQTDVSSMEAYLRVRTEGAGENSSSVKKIIEAVTGNERRLQFARIGHTNAADAGLDIWSNFGVIVSVKNRTLDAALVTKVLEDTPIGDLVIACENYTQDAADQIASNSQNRSVSLVTKNELMHDVERLLSNAISRVTFLKVFISNFDHEFPRNNTLESFMASRGYAITEPNMIVTS